MPKKLSSSLVQITKSPIPPLRQSTQETMSCPKFYTEVFIKGRKSPSGLDAARGTEIHKTMAAYLSHCARKQVGMDLDAFEIFSRGAGPQAYKILSGLRDGYVVDFAHLFATEISMALDENFQPTDVSNELGGVSVDTGLPAAYQGTLDGLYVFREENKILIDDFKSHARPFDPDDKPQGKQYSLFVFQHFSWVEEVVFRLTFVRYKNLSRSVTYTRKQVPVLIEALRAARARQETLHVKYDAGEEIEAISGAGCVYCPLLSNRECPIAEWNPQSQLTPEDRLKYLLWYSAFSKINSKTLRDYVDGTGKKVILKDYMGRAYVFGPVESESKVYPLFEATATGIATDKQGNPLMPIVSLLLDTTLVPPDDREWLSKLVISSTKIESALKAKKRVLAHHAITDAAEKVTKAPLKVSKPLDALPPEDEEEDGDGDWEDNDEF
jgi:PD-(D/E)XK nuclease superfamily